jgi:hypothetical protein
VLAVLALALVVESGVFFLDYFGPYPARAAAQVEVNGNKPGAFRALMEGTIDTQVFYDVEDAATTTFARFFKAQHGFGGAVLPAPPEWADRLPPGARVMTTRPDAYGAGFEVLSAIPEMSPNRPNHTIIRKVASR